MKPFPFALLGITVLMIGCDSSTNRNAKTCQTQQQSKAGIVGEEATLPSNDLKSRATVGLRLVSGKYLMHCSGVIVGPQLVLTAAHCMEDDPFQEVSFGASLPSSVRIPVTSFMIHPNWAGQVGNNDIAWLKLASPIPSSAAIAEVITPAQVSFLTEGMPVTLVGYGVTSTKGIDAGIKRNTTTVLDRYEENGSQDEVDVVRSFILGPTPMKAACYGDSGGPAFIEFQNMTYLIGTTSGARVFNANTACERGVGFWTAVHAYRDWIEQTSQTKLGNPVMANTPIAAPQPPLANASPSLPTPSVPTTPGASTNAPATNPTTGNAAAKTATEVKNCE